MLGRGDRREGFFNPVEALERRLGLYQVVKTLGTLWLSIILAGAAQGDLQPLQAATDCAHVESSIWTHLGIAISP
jgi:hypothetical protein